jgi:hypothetical protein
VNLALPLLVLLAVDGGAPLSADTRAMISRRLVELMQEDQAERRALSPRLGEGDRARTEELRAIVNAYGWPDASMVGRKAALAAWAIVQHADQDVAFQKRCLRLLKQAVARGDGDPGSMAYLEDRVRVNEGRPQVYGTQYERPIEDMAHVDARRAQVGLEPLAEYLRRGPVSAPGARGGAPDRPPGTR